MEVNKQQDGDYYFMESLLQTKNGLTGDPIDGYNLLELDVEEAQSSLSYSCDSCNKTYKTKNGYDRHVRKSHSTISATVISDYMITDFFKSALVELGADFCYPETIRNKWKFYQMQENKTLYAIVKKIYSTLVSTSNAERFYEQFYSQTLASPSFFPKLHDQLCVELLRKGADKILAHFITTSRPSPEYIEPSMTPPEIDALDYLGGYVLHNLEKKLARKKDSSSLLILKCFENDND